MNRGDRQRAGGDRGAAPRHSRGGTRTLVGAGLLVRGRGLSRVGHRLTRGIGRRLHHAHLRHTIRLKRTRSSTRHREVESEEAREERCSQTRAFHSLSVPASGSRFPGSGIVRPTRQRRTTNISDVFGDPRGASPAEGDDYAIGGRKNAPASKSSCTRSVRGESCASGRQGASWGGRSAGRASTAPQAPVAPMGTLGQFGAPESLSSGNAAPVARNEAESAEQDCAGAARSAEAAADSASIFVAHVAAQTPSTEKVRSPISAKSAARNRKRSFIRLNLYASPASGNPAEIGDR